MPAHGDVSLDPARIRATGFSTAFRGYDQNEVRRYLEQLAEALRARSATPSGEGAARARAAEHRAGALEAQIAELHATVAELRDRLAARDQESALPAFDAERAAELLGRETARVLEAARRAAAELTRTAAADAGRIRAEAEAERASVEAEVRRTLAEAVTDADAIRAAAREDADRILAEAGGRRDDVLAELERAERAGSDRLRQLEGRKVELGRALHDLRGRLDEVIGALHADDAAGAPVTPVAHPTADRGGCEDREQRDDRAERHDPPDEDRSCATAVEVEAEAPGPPVVDELDALFTKVRASRSKAVADARQVLAARPAQDPARGDSPPGIENGSVDGVQRQALRQLKRAMADAQSELLDVVGRSDTALTPQRLPTPGEQRRWYEPAAAAAIRAGLEAGAGAGGADDVDEASCEGLSAALAARVAEALHARVAQCLEVAGGDTDVLLECIRSQYREFRAGELEPLVAAAVAEARRAGEPGPAR